MNNKMSVFLKSAGFSIPVLIFLILFLVIYYKKKSDKENDKKVYTFLLNIIPTPIILELIGVGLAIFLPETFANKKMILTVLFRIYFVITYFWIIIFCLYQVLFVFKS